MLICNGVPPTTVPFQVLSLAAEVRSMGGECDLRL